MGFAMLQADLEMLRRQIAHVERGSAPAPHALFSTGSAAIDAALQGGVARAALHEVFAESLSDEPAAAAFAIALTLRASADRPVVWVRQDFVGLEMGEIYAPGLVELGLSPDRLILVRVRDGPSVLRAAEEAARCSSLGAVLVEPWGNPKSLDLTSTRRLSLAAARSNLPVFMIRAGGTPTPSSAMTRWSIRSAVSGAFPSDAPGSPRFAASLVRDRIGAAGCHWTVEWNRDRLAFEDISANGSALSGRLVSVAANRPDHAPQERRRAG